MAGDHFLNLQPGTIVNGRYEVVKCLGTGSMGMVYACRHRELAGHIVAMKVLFPEVARDEVAAARFRNEIVASYGVSHPNVVRAYEYFRDGDLIAFTMEYISGGDIADKIANSDKINIDEVVRMLTQMCSGVQAIHDAGIIHRDLKPENILLTTQGDIKITDFGIARAGTGPRLTDHGGVVGTIDYVSPEYLERGEVDARSDIYALGVIAYEMITHESPFKGKSVIETMTLRLRTDPEPPSGQRADCPPALDAIVLRAMARDPANRYQAAREMFQDLQAMTRGGEAPRPRATPPSGSRPGVSGERNGVRPTPRVNAPFPKEGSIAATLGPSAYNPQFSTSIVESHAEELHADGTVQVARSASSTMKAPPLVADFVEEETDYGSPLESVLSSSRLTGREPRFGSEDGLTPPPAVAISQSHLSTDRLKALSSDLQQPAFSGGWLGSFFSAVLIFFLGFGVGWLLLKHFKPELFESTPSDPAAVAAEKTD
ncbi:MAG: protein kinase [Bdellovibrionota bacterium]